MVAVLPMNRKITSLNVPPGLYCHTKVMLLPSKTESGSGGFVENVGAKRNKEVRAVCAFNDVTFLSEETLQLKHFLKYGCQSPRKPLYFRMFKVLVTQCLNLKGSFCR